MEDFEADLGAALEELTPADLKVLGITAESQLEERAVFLHMIYTNPRYAPENKDEKWAEIQEVFAKIGYVPKDYDRKVGTYCGNHYLLPGMSLGSLAKCKRLGQGQGDRHGKLNAQQGWS